MDFIVFELKLEEFIVARWLLFRAIVSILVSGLGKFPEDFFLHALFIKILFLRIVNNILVPLNCEMCHFLEIFVLTWGLFAKKEAPNFVLGIFWHKNILAVYFQPWTSITICWLFEPFIGIIKNQVRILNSIRGNYSLYRQLSVFERAVLSQLLRLDFFPQ